MDYNNLKDQNKNQGNPQAPVAKEVRAKSTSVFCSGIEYIEELEIERWFAGVIQINKP